MLERIRSAPPTTNQHQPSCAWKAVCFLGSILRTVITNPAKSIVSLLALSSGIQLANGKSLNKRSVLEHSNPNDFRVTNCGGGSDSYFSVHSNTGGNSVGSMRVRPGDTTQYRYDNSGNKTHKIMAEATFKESPTHPAITDHFTMSCPNGSPFVEGGFKGSSILFSYGCDESGRVKCKNYNEWNPPREESSCVIS